MLTLEIKQKVPYAVTGIGMLASACGGYRCRYTLPLSWYYSCNGMVLGAWQGVALLGQHSEHISLVS